MTAWTDTYNAFYVAATGLLIAATAFLNGCEPALKIPGVV